MNLSIHKYVCIGYQIFEDCNVFLLDDKVKIFVINACIFSVYCIRRLKMSFNLSLITDCIIDNLFVISIGYFIHFTCTLLVMVYCIMHVQDLLSFCCDICNEAT